MKKFLFIFLPFLIIYKVITIVIWDIAWVANCEWILRAFYIITSSLFSLAILAET